MVLFGIGFGGVTQILMVAIQNAVAPREIGTATASANLFRALGGSVECRVRRRVRCRAAPLAAGRAGRSGRAWRLGDQHPGRAQPDPRLAPSVQRRIAQAVGHSLHDVFLVAGPIALAGFLIVMVLASARSRSRSDRQDELSGPHRGNMHQERAAA